MEQVKVKLISHGGYDGLKHLSFPIVVDGFVHPVNIRTIQGGRELPAH